MTPKEFALNAIKHTTSIIPVGKDKVPLIPWKTFQERLATEKEIEKWWAEWPEANVGIVTGKISNLTVVDVEKGGDISIFPETDTIETGGGGWHLYYTYTPFENKARIFPLTDIRGDGGYVVAPGSTHQSGKKYKLVKHIGRAPFPKKLFGVRTPSKWKEKLLSPIPEGERNTDFTSIVGAMMEKFPQHEWETIVWSMVKDKNAAQETPLNERELRVVFASIAQRELRKRSTGGDIKDILVENVEDDINVEITLANAVVCFRIKNIIGNLLEANVITWIKKNTGLSHELPYYLKLRSDTNKDFWARMLVKAFDKKEDKEIYPWTILIAKLCAEFEKKIREHIQDFHAPDVEARDVSWMLEPFIQRDQINTFFGLGSSGKTMLAMYFSTLVARDGVNTLLIDYENDAYSWVDKIRKIIGQESQEHFTYYDSEQIPLAEQLEKIKEVVRRRNIGLVIVDSASLSTGESTTDERAAIRLISALKLLRTTAIVIAHQRKNDGDKTPIGSIQYENQARNVWNFKSTPDDFDNQILHIACTHTKANNTYLRRNPVGYKVEFGTSAIYITREDAIENFEEKFSLLKRIEKLLREQGAMGRKEIASLLGANAGTVNKYLTIGKNEGIFENNDEKWSLKRKPNYDDF